MVACYLGFQRFGQTGSIGSSLGTEGRAFWKLGTPTPSLLLKLALMRIRPRREVIICFMRGELSIGAFFCARLHPFREIAAAIIVTVVRNRQIKESPGSRRPLAIDLLVNPWFLKRLKYSSAHEGLRLSVRPGNVTRY
jgi:hypothetical protein